MSDSTKAVFLSYAREDAEPARRARRGRNEASWQYATLNAQHLTFNAQHPMTAANNEFWRVRVSADRGSQGREPSEGRDLER